MRSYLNDLAVFPTFFTLSLNLAIRSSCSEPQSAPALVSPDYVEFLHLWLQGHSQVFKKRDASLSYFEVGSNVLFLGIWDKFI